VWPKIVGAWRKGLRPRPSFPPYPTEVEGARSFLGAWELRPAPVTPIG